MRVVFPPQRIEKVRSVLVTERLKTGPRPESQQTEWHQPCHHHCWAPNRWKHPVKPMQVCRTGPLKAGVRCSQEKNDEILLSEHFSLIEKKKSLDFRLV